jgi:hypothetical protein
MGKTRALLFSFSVIFLAGILLAPVQASNDVPTLDNKSYLPMISKNDPKAASFTINHLHTDISKIPTRWIDAARALTVAFAHTSHGSQILTGLQWLETQDARYNIAVRTTNEGTGLPSDVSALRLYDGNNVPNNDYITPELYWSTTTGMNYTRSVAQTGQFKLAGWAWCGQQSTNTLQDVNQYLNTLNTFETEFPDMRFIYFTGHTDGSGSSGTLQRNNDLVRQYVSGNQKILFDFADIESYDPSGTYYPNTDDSCPWCQNYCTVHPGACANLSQMSDCAHSDKLQCKLKAQAFWWMAARIAGWDGVSP